MRRPLTGISTLRAFPRKGSYFCPPGDASPVFTAQVTCPRSCIRDSLQVGWEELPGEGEIHGSFPVSFRSNPVAHVMVWPPRRGRSDVSLFGQSLSPALPAQKQAFHPPSKQGLRASFCRQLAKIRPARYDATTISKQNQGYLATDPVVSRKPPICSAVVIGSEDAVETVRKGDPS